MTDNLESTLSFQQMMKLAAVGASGIEVKIGRIDWSSVLQCAYEQDTHLLVACALLVQPSLDCQDRLREQLLDMLREKSGANYIRKTRILFLLKEMETLGIDVKLLKGYSVGECYAYPESRNSADTDLLISEEEETKSIEFLNKRGFRIKPRGEMENHSVCQHSKLGMVELHTQLYHEIIQSVWFKDPKKNRFIQEESIRVHGKEGSYSTLGYTDHLIFMTLHMIKHFIYDGLGLRMMLDIALYIKKNKEVIDAQRYWNLLEELRYSRLINGILWTMIQTECFNTVDFPGIQEMNYDDVKLILLDLQIGGHMGIKEGSANRLDGYYEYNRQIILKEKSYVQYCVYMLCSKIRSAKKQMFPRTENLLEIYPILKKYGWMTPVFRIYRLLEYPIHKISTGTLREQIRSDSTHISEEAKRRVDMFKKLEMM